MNFVLLHFSTKKIICKEFFAILTKFYVPFFGRIIGIFILLHIITKKVTPYASIERRINFHPKYFSAMAMQATTPPTAQLSS